MTYRAMILATVETNSPFTLILTLVEAPAREISKRSVIEGAIMTYADADDFRSILSSKGGDSDLTNLDRALSSARKIRGIMQFAGFFDLSPDDLYSLGFKTMSDMAKYASHA
jgi:hypothetical protein